MKEPRRPDLAAFQEELEYWVDFKTGNLHSGRRPSAGSRGQGFSFEKFERLSNHPDFRRIDVSATRRNPLANEPLVRVYKPTSRVDVILLADLSLSVSCGLAEPKLHQIAKLATLFGYSAFRAGDRFGFVAFDRRVLEEFYQPPVGSGTAGLEVGERILDFRPSQTYEGQPLGLEKFLPEKKSLVVFVSDFYFEPDALKPILVTLARHRVLPILLRQEKERRWPKGLFGVVNLKDSETGRERAVFFSPRTIREFEKMSRKNEEDLRKVFHSLSAEPILLEEVNPDRVFEELARRSQ